VTINVDAEREAVARLLYRWDCEAQEDWDGEWDEDYWDDLQIDSERDEWRHKAVLMMDAMVGTLTSLWQVQRLDGADGKLREIRDEVDSWSNLYQDDRVHEWTFSGRIKRILDRPS